MDSDKILTLTGLNDVSNLINENFINSYNLTIQYIERGLFGRKGKVKTLFEVDGKYQDVINDKNYVDIIMEDVREKRFIKIDNFAFNNDYSRIASKDFRVLVDDLNGNVPRDVLLHVASVATLMLSNKLEIPIGYDYITEFMKKYGYTEFKYNSNGYLHITLKENSLFSIRGGVPLVQKYK